MDKVILDVVPGICGFHCRIQAERKGRRSVQLRIVGSDCAQIRALAANLPEMTVAQLFVPLTQNPIFQAAEEMGCHLSCPIPAALIKAAEAALELALPKDVQIRFVGSEKESGCEEI